MSEQAARLSGKCQTCGSPCDGWGVQLTRDNRPCWELTWDCDVCGTVSDDGDWGPAPAELRKELLLQHGGYCLRLREGNSGGAKILLVFRQVFNSNFKDAQEFRSKLRGCGYEGTFVETDLLSNRLQQEGIITVVIRSPTIR